MVNWPSLLPRFIITAYCMWFVICRTDPDTVYQLFVEVLRITGGQGRIHQQYPTDNVDNVTSSFACYLHVNVPCDTVTCSAMYCLCHSNT